MDVTEAFFFFFFSVLNSWVGSPCTMHFRPHRFYRFFSNERHGKSLGTVPGFAPMVLMFWLPSRVRKSSRAGGATSHSGTVLFGPGMKMNGLAMLAFDLRDSH